MSLSMHPVPEAKPRAGPLDEVVANLEVVLEDVQHPRRRIRFHLQECNRAISQLLEARFNRFEQIVCLGLLDLEVGVANDPEEVRPFHLRSGK